jgi:putative Mn2+ efflux pump MntP
MDALAVSIAAGLKIERVTWRHIFRAAWHFGLFQFLMPLAGYGIGKTVAWWIRAWNAWIAFALLTAVAVKMLVESRTGEPGIRRADPTRGWSLVVLAVATSIDALLVGVTLAVQGMSIWMPAAIIGIVAGLLSGLGIHFAGRLGTRWEHRAEWIGAAVLFAVGLEIVLEHVLRG